MRYSTFGCEFLTGCIAVWTSNIWWKERHSRQDRPTFPVKTDQHSLSIPTIEGMKRAEDRNIPCEMQHLNYINIYTTDVWHISATDNIVADVLSRIAEYQPVKDS